MTCSNEYIDQLAALENEDLIRPLSKDGSEFIFKHALIQDAAYELLLKQDRRRLHFGVAQVLEQMYADDLDACASELVQHYAAAGDDRKTYEYAMRAGDVAARLHAYPEARSLYLQAFGLLPPEVRTPNGKRERVDALISQVSVSLFADDLNEQSQRLDEAQSILHSMEMDDQDHLRHARIHYWLGRVFSFQNKMKPAIESYQHVLGMANGLDDPEMLALPPAVIGRALVLQGHWAKAEPLLRQALVPLKRVGKLYDYVLTLAFIGMTEMAQGNFRQAKVTVLDALEQAHASEHPTAINVVRVAYGYILLNGGEYELVVEQARRAERAARESDDHAWVYVAHGLCGWALGRMGQYAEAMEEFANQEPFPARLGGSIVLSDWFDAARAEMTLAQGEIGRARDLAEATVTLTRKLGGVYAEGLAERVWGQALGKIDSTCWAEAEAHLRASLDLFEKENARLEAARTCAALGELFYKRHDLPHAREYWSRSASTFSAAGLEEELAQVKNLVHEGELAQ